VVFWGFFAAVIGLASPSESEILSNFKKQSHRFFVGT
jgi:hypothetical protein